MFNVQYSRRCARFRLRSWSCGRRFTAPQACYSFTTFQIRKSSCKSKEPRQGRGSFKFEIRPALLEAGRDRGELGVQRGAQVIDDSDDRQRDTGGNQTVFNGGGAGFILRETRNEVLHKELQMSTRGYN